MTQQVQTQTKKRGRGRPSEYHEETINDACRALRAGATDVELAEQLSISVGTLYRWKLEHPEFREAISQAKEQIDERVERSLFHRSLGYTVQTGEKIVDKPDGTTVVERSMTHVPADVKAATMWLMNRQPQKWRDRQEIALSGGIDITNKLGERELALAMIQVLRDAGDAADEPATIEHQEDRPAIMQVEQSGSRRFG